MSTDELRDALMETMAEGCDLSDEFWCDLADALIAGPLAGLLRQAALLADLIENRNAVDIRQRLLAAGAAAPGEQP